MTALNEPLIYRDGDDDFWTVLLPEAAEHAIDCGYAAAPLLHRRMRVGMDVAQQLVDELADASIVGDLDGTNRPALVDHDQAATILAGLADPDQPANPPTPQPVILDDDQIEEANQAPLVSLTKPTSQPRATPASQPGDEDDEPGGELVVRPDDDLTTYQPGELEPWRPAGGGSLGGRVQETWWRVIDHPATARTGAVTRQIPKAGGRLVRYTPRGATRLAGMVCNALFATRAAAMVARIADTDPLGEAWVKASAEHGKVHERLATRRWLAGGLAFLAILVAMAWWAPQAFAGVLAVVVFVGVVAFARGVCRDPKELATCVAAAAGGAAIVWFTGTDLAGLVPRPNLPWWGWLALVVVGVAICGWHGRQDGQSLVDTPGMAYKPPPITAPMIVEALFRIGVAGMTPTAAEKGMRDEIRVRAPGVGRAKHGWQIELELPPGITAGDIAKQREELAGALRRPLGCVWPSGGGDHPGHLRIYIGDKPMATAPQTEWPLASGHAIDIFDPFPLLTDKEGQWVDVTLLGTHAVVAGASGFGKSVTLRELAVACALDPRVRLYVFDGKISGDLAPLQKVAHAYYEGAEPDDIAEQLAAMQSIEQEMRRRARFLRDLPPEERSPKVTSALASKYSRLSPIVLLIDECQEYTEYGVPGVKADKEIRTAFIASLTRISRLGRSAGIAMVLVSQKPEAAVIPTAIMGNCAIRICHKVTEQNHNDQVLGTSAYKNGYNAALFSQEDRGLAWLRGEGDPQVVRSWSVMVDLEPAVELVEKAWQLRKAKGLLTGQAADDGVLEAEVVYDIVQDAERVMSVRGCGKAQWGELVPWLQELRGQYAALTEEELSVSIRTAGVRVADVRSGGSVRKGVYISDLRKRGSGDDG
jgi:S-DNA-T family DNA segregation ATPase FtsK/SpoIIIE